MYLAMFLVALVGTSFRTLCRVYRWLTTYLGPDNHRDPLGRNHQRVQLDPRCRVVWQFVHVDQRLFYSRLWSPLQTLLDKMGFLDLDFDL